jgi:hypothetical protein
MENRFSEIQQAVHVAKDKKNDFGGYNYRTAEGILAAVKSVLRDGESIILTDELREVAGQIFVEAEATLCTENQKYYIKAKGFAMHPITKKGMDPSQITGSASSYARKYALSGLFALDDGSADPDAAKEAYAPAPKEPEQPFNADEIYAKIKAAIWKQGSIEALDKLWAHKATEAAFAQFSDDDKQALLQEYSSKQGELA